jgi:hypothetical protein
MAPKLHEEHDEPIKDRFAQKNVEIPCSAEPPIWQAKGQHGNVVGSHPIIRISNIWSKKQI